MAIFRASFSSSDKTIMEFLASPFKRLKTHLPGLLPYGIGFVAGFLGVSKVLAFLLEKHPDPSVCVFVGLIAGMLPSLFLPKKAHWYREHK